MNRVLSHFLFAVAATTLSATPIFATGSGETPGAGAQEAADADTPAGPDTRVLTDALGREVAVPAEPGRVATAGRAVLMIVDVIYAFEDARETLVGVGRIRQGRGNFARRLDPNYDEKTIFERNAGPEQVAAVDPDLVILKTFMRGPLGESLEELGIPVLYVGLETPEQYQRDIRVIGRALGERERAEQLAAWYQQKTDEIEQQTVYQLERRQPDALLISYRESSGEATFQIPPDGWIQTQMVESAGARAIWRGANTGGGWATVNFEQIASWDPDTIMLVDYDGNAASIRDQLVQEPRWQELLAVRQGRLYAFPSDFYSWDQPDTRWILGLQWMATKLQPEQFRNLDMNAATREFYRVVYGLSEERYNELIRPMISGDID